MSVTSKPSEPESGIFSGSSTTSGNDTIWVGDGLTTGDFIINTTTDTTDQIINIDPNSLWQINPTTIAQPFDVMKAFETLLARMSELEEKIEALGGK